MICTTDDIVMTWKRVKIHGFPAARYVGRGSFGMEKLREELEVENDPCRSQVVGPSVGRHGPPCGGNDQGVLGRFPGIGRGNLRPPSEEWAAAFGPPVQCRGLRGGAAGRGVRPLQQVGPYQDPVHPRCLLHSIYAQRSIAPTDTGAPPRGTCQARTRRAHIS